MPRGAPDGGGPHAMAQMAQWLIRPCPPRLHICASRNLFDTLGSSFNGCSAMILESISNPEIRQVAASIPVLSQWTSN